MSSSYPLVAVERPDSRWARCLQGHGPSSPGTDSDLYRSSAVDTHKYRRFSRYRHPGSDSRSSILPCMVGAFSGTGVDMNSSTTPTNQGFLSSNRYTGQIYWSHISLGSDTIRQIKSPIQCDSGLVISRQLRNHAICLQGLLYFLLSKLATCLWWCPLWKLNSASGMIEKTVQSGQNETYWLKGRMTKQHFGESD